MLFDLQGALFFSTCSPFALPSLCGEQKGTMQRSYEVAVVFGGWSSSGFCLKRPDKNNTSSESAQ